MRTTVEGCCANKDPVDGLICRFRALQISLAHGVECYRLKQTRQPPAAHADDAGRVYSSVIVAIAQPTLSLALPAWRPTASRRCPAPAIPSMTSPKRSAIQLKF